MGLLRAGRFDSGYMTKGSSAAERGSSAFWSFVRNRYWTTSSIPPASIGSPELEEFFTIRDTLLNPFDLGSAGSVEVNAYTPLAGSEISRVPLKKYLSSPAE